MTERESRREMLASAGLGALAISVGGMGGCGPRRRTPGSQEARKDAPSMHAMTAGNLRSAFGGESMAHMRYTIWGGKAHKDGYPNVARLFRAIAYAEEVHASNHFGAMKDEAGAHLVASMAGFGLGTTSANLAGAIEGETFEVEEMYPVYKQAAELQGEQAAARSCHYALEAERIHARMFAVAKKAVDAGKDVQLGPVQICSNCGHTCEGEAPARCPVCGVPRERYVEFATMNPYSARAPGVTLEAIALFLGAGDHTAAQLVVPIYEKLLRQMSQHDAAAFVFDALEMLAETGDLDFIRSQYGRFLRRYERVAAPDTVILAHVRVADTWLRDERPNSQQAQRHYRKAVRIFEGVKLEQMTDPTPCTIAFGL